MQILNNRALIKRFNLFTIALITICLTACSSIPIMVPDMAPSSSKKITLENSNGPLSPQQSQKILARLKKNNVETNIFDKHLVLISQVIGSPLTVGNKVDLLVDGPNTYAAMLSAINNAKDHINMETYIIESDEVGNLFATALMAKQRDGVQVNLIYDSVGSINTPKEFFDMLKSAGVNVLEFNPINPLNARKDWDVNQRDHRKLLIVDGKTAFLGGINISSVYSSGSRGGLKGGFGSGSGGKSNRKPITQETVQESDKDQASKSQAQQSLIGDQQINTVVPKKSDATWRDTHLKVSGPVVNEFQQMFLATWAQQKGDALAKKEYFPLLANEGNEIVRAIASSPEEPYSQIYATLLSAINSAETQILLTNAYFVPDPQLLAALKAAVKRGVVVKLLLPEKTDSSLVFYASRSYYHELLSAGVQIYEHQVALLHAKTAVIDGVWSTVGSTNLDWRSFVSNQEINAVMLGQDFGLQMRQLFDKDLSVSKQITLNQWLRRPLSLRAKEKAARLWARFL